MAKTYFVIHECAKNDVAPKYVAETLPSTLPELRQIICQTQQNIWQMTIHAALADAQKGNGGNFILLLVVSPVWC